MATLKNFGFEVGTLTLGKSQDVRDATRSGSVRGGFTVGHPLGGALSLILGPARFTGRYTDWSSERHAHYLRYTTETRPGNPGGPIFDEEWRVVAVHQSGHDGGAGGEKARRGLMVSSLVDVAGPVLRELAPQLRTTG